MSTGVEHFLSYSQLNGWSTCGEQYRLERVVKAPARPAWANVGGSTVHALTEDHDRRTVGENVPERTWDEVFEENTVEQEERSGMDRSEFRASGRASKQWPDKEDPEWWRANGPAMVQRWVNFRRGVPWEIWETPEGEPGIELEFHLLFDNVDVRGFIDRVFWSPEGYLIVCDLKSGTYSPPSPRQLGVYKVAVEQEFGVELPYGVYWNARTGSTTPPADLSGYTLERLTWQFSKLVEARERGIFIASPSNLCNSCGVRDYCAEVGGERAHEVAQPWSLFFDRGVELPRVAGEAK